MDHIGKNPIISLYQLVTFKIGIDDVLTILRTYPPSFVKLIYPNGQQLREGFHKIKVGAVDLIAFFKQHYPIKVS